MGKELAPSNKALVITENKRLLMSLRTMMAKKNIEVETRYLNLTSLAIIRKVVGNVKNTAPIRTEMFRFIKESGMPHLIAIDYEIDLKLGDDLDPDRKKLLRTLLISYIILSRGRGFETLRGHFIIFAEPHQYEKLREYEDMPARILDLLNTQSDVVNSFISDLRANPVMFNRLFYFKAVDVASPPGEQQEKIELFLNTVEERIKQQVLLKNKPQSVVVNEGGAPASVVFRVSGSTCIVDCAEKQDDGGDAFAGAVEGEFTIVGSWNGGNHTAVSGMLLKMVNKLVDDGLFDPANGVVISLGDACRPDGATAASLAQVVVKDLKRYGAVKVRAVEKHRKTLENSKGYGLLKEFIVY